jgi:light-regulated signal transduction histidine kinase (bacteriophytochrome)/AmiR/NasT family two-component response regulator
MSEASIANDDKEDCAREPIHISGAIQPHGYLVVLSAVDHAVIAVSQNFADALELSVADMIGRPVSDFLTSTAAEPLNTLLAWRERGPLIRVILRNPHRTDALDGVVRIDGDAILLELEASTSSEAESNLFSEVRIAIERIRHTVSIESACQCLVSEVRRLSGFDRVMVYRFDEELNGEIIAEVRLDGMPSFLGYGFPASDIPAQARALYLLNTVRTIPDALYQPSQIIPALHPISGRPFDLSTVTLRSVSPVHLDYMANMGVAASMSVSIIRDNRLWGLVACHHQSPRILPQSVLQSCDLLGQAVGWYLDLNDRDAAALSVAAVRRLEPDLEGPELRSNEHQDFRDRLASIETSLLATTRSDGLAILTPEALWAIGVHPSVQQIKAIADWLSMNGEGRVATDRLSRLYPPAADFNMLASGMVASRLGAGWLIWFRAEWLHTLTWAGSLEQVQQRNAETGWVNPRKSFEAWLQKIVGRSLPWTIADLAAVDEVQALVLKALASDHLWQLTQSERALTEAKLSAEAASVAKSSFLAQMSHEIRTPLNGVLGMAQVMATDTLSDDQRVRLKVIQKSGSSLLTILSDILDLSKIEAGRLDLEEAPFDIAELAEDAFAVFESIASAKGLGFVLDVRGEARGAWRGDSVRVRQLISNLVSNALKFTSHGDVRLTVDALQVDGAKVLILSVADTGIGVSPEALPKLFDAFVQADSTTTRRFGGTGLGLTICQHIAECMGGGIAVRSELGKGTVFDVRLPLEWLGAQCEQFQTAPDAAAEHADISSLRILAADDNETNRLVLKSILAALGVSAEIVDNGRSAVDAWAAGGYDLVLMDVQMPILDGLLATAEIRGIEARRERVRTPIIAFSANAMTHQIAGYLAAGFDGHLAKPVVMAELCAVLESVVAAPSKETAALSVAL